MRVLQDGLKILDILVITETCFSSKTNEDLFAIPGYELFRKDRSARSGGGVAIYVNTDLAVKQRADLEEPEILWLEVCPFKSKRPLLMVGVYRYPDAKADYDRQLTENTERASLLNMKAILQGHFNLDYRRIRCFNRHRFVKDLKDLNFCYRDFKNLDHVKFIKDLEEVFGSANDPRTANSPQTVPQMIPYWTANDPGTQMIPILHWTANYPEKKK